MPHTYSPETELLMTWIRDHTQVVPPIQPDQPPPGAAHHPVHPLSHVDFWATLGAMVCFLALASNALSDLITVESVYFTGIFLCMGSMVANLLRDREVVTVYKFTITDGRPRPSLFGHSEPKTFAEAQAKAGITPLKRSARAESNYLPEVRHDH